MHLRRLVDVEEMARLIRRLRRSGIIEREGDGSLRVDQGGLIGGEQPGAVSFERTADGEAGLDAPVGIFRVRHVLGAGRVRGHSAEGLSRPAVERVAFEVDQGVAAPGVGAALRHDVDDAARGAAVFGGVPARLHLNLVDELRQDVMTRQAADQVRGLDAIDDEPVLRGARAVDGDAPELRLLVGPRRLADEAS